MEDIGPIRRLAAAVVKHAFDDLLVPSRHAEAHRFLTRTLSSPDCIWATALKLNPEIVKRTVEEILQRGRVGTLQEYMEEEDEA